MSWQEKLILRYRRTTNRLRHRYIIGKKYLQWWLIYGPPRCGTTYMFDAICTCSVLCVSDWDLGSVVHPIQRQMTTRAARLDYIRLDYQRLLADLSRNVLTNAYIGGGHALDLVYKEVLLDKLLLRGLVRMWGQPRRIIFCFREPLGYIRSAVKKFPQARIQNLQDTYIRALQNYYDIGGDVFEYAPDRSTDDYISFLQPLSISKHMIRPFRYVYRRRNMTGLVTQNMRDAYNEIKRKTGKSRRTVQLHKA